MASLLITFHMQKVGVLILIGCILSTSACSQPSAWEATVNQFRSSYQRLDLAGLRIAYVDNLNGIQSLEALKRQAEVFAELRTQLDATDQSLLTSKEQLDYDLLQYHLHLHEERIALERKWWDKPLSPVPTTGLANLPNGKDWYIYFLKCWLDISVTPDSLFEFGLQEIDKVKARMTALQQKSGKDSIDFQEYIGEADFFYTDAATVQTRFEAFGQEMKATLGNYFPGMDRIPGVRVRQSTDSRMAQVPGFYRNNTFYYNIFDQSFNRRQIAWLFLHEAIPGHHYERSYSAALPQSEVQQLFYYPCYSEGWAAYVEEIGYEIGAYQDIYDELGKWEWDIIRSVRVPLDIGLNYYGWSDEKAMAFWQQHIIGQDDIAEREIARMKRWPCQVITYKYGANKILKWKALKENEPGFDLKEFHRELLQYGPLPFSLLEGRLLATNN